VGLGVVLCIAAIVNIEVQRPSGIVLESAHAEHAVENSFFDQLAAKDLAKDKRSRNAKDLHSSHTSLSAKQERAIEDSYFKGVGSTGTKNHKLAAHKVPAKHWKPLPYNKLVHRGPFKGAHTKLAGKPMKAKKVAHNPTSMRAEFKKAQQQLAAEQTKMRHIEEHDHVKAEEQKIELERLKAHQQAGAYERHLSKLNDAVFPSSMDSDMGTSASHAVSHALTDDMHVPKITKADYERHPMHAPKAIHGSNRVFRRVVNSGKDFVKQVITGKAVSHSHLRAPVSQLHAAPAKEAEPAAH